MKRKAIRAGFAVSALALAISPAMAADLRFDGFASFVAGQVLDEDELSGEDFRGYDGDLSFNENSLFAVQVRADLADKLSATAQIIAKGSEGYDAKFNWAYMAYQLTNELNLKAGRFRSPLFMYSDFLDVGYAYHWISPPDSVYNLSGFDSTDGVMLEHQTDWGPVTSNASLSVGRTVADLEGGTLDSKRSWTVTWGLNYDWLTFRLVHSEADVTISGEQFDSLSGALENFGVSEATLDSMLLESDYGSFDGVGIGIDTGSFFAVAEYTETKGEDSFSPDPTKAWYVSAGARFGQWTLYGTVENKQSDIPQETMDAVLAEFDADVATKTGQQAGLAQLIAGLIGGAPIPGYTLADVPALQANYSLLGLGLDAAPDLRDGVTTLFNQSNVDQDVYSVGVRYDFHPAAALKFEYTEMEDNVTDLKPSSVAIAVDLVY